jgi:DNA-binding NarL/FixJ family response regulator
MPNPNAGKPALLGRRFPMLTERQRQIAELVAEGLREREIAERLGLSRNTIRNHKQAIFHKLGARNSIEMIRLLEAA